MERFLSETKNIEIICVASLRKENFDVFDVVEVLSSFPKNYGFVARIVLQKIRKIGKHIVRIIHRCSKVSFFIQSFHSQQDKSLKIISVQTN